MTTDSSIGERIARLETQMSALIEADKALKDEFAEYVTQHEFKPIRVAYYGLMVAIGSGLTAAFFSRVLGIT